MDLTVRVIHRFEVKPNLRGRLQLKMCKVV